MSNFDFTSQFAPIRMSFEDRLNLQQAEISACISDMLDAIEQRRIRLEHVCAADSNVEMLERLSSELKYVNYSIPGLLKRINALLEQRKQLYLEMMGPPAAYAEYEAMYKLVDDPAYDEPYMSLYDL